MSKILIPVRDSSPKVQGVVAGAEEAVLVPMPTWTDPSSIAAWLTALIGTAVTIITIVQPGFTLPAVVTASVAPVSMLVAGAAVVINLIRHTKATVAAIGR